MAIDQDFPNNTSRRIEVKDGAYNLQGWKTSNKNPSTFITADQAKRLTDENQRWQQDLEWIYDRIQKAAKRGESSITINNLAYNVKVVDHLDTNGYKVEVLNDQWKIYW